MDTTGDQPQAENPALRTWHTQRRTKTRSEKIKRPTQRMDILTLGLGMQSNPKFTSLIQLEEAPGVFQVSP